MGMDHKGGIERNIDARKFNLYVLLPSHFPFGTLTSKELHSKLPTQRVHEDVYCAKSKKSASFQQRSYFPNYLSLGSRMPFKFRKIDQAYGKNIGSNLPDTLRLSQARRRVSW